MKPLPESFWPESLTRAGQTATREQMEDAWLKWPGGRATGLIYSLHFFGAGDRHKPSSCARISDAMLQKAREAGFIAHGSQGWSEVSEEDMDKDKKRLERALERKDRLRRRHDAEAALFGFYAHKYRPEPMSDAQVRGAVAMIWVIAAVAAFVVGVVLALWL